MSMISGFVKKLSVSNNPLVANKPSVRRSSIVKKPVVKKPIVKRPVVKKVPVMKKPVAKKVESIQKPEIVPSLARVESGIPGLDKMLHGGFPEISTIMISGASGTGKTMFVTQSLFHAAALGQPVLYITFSEPVYKVINFASNLKFFDLKLIEQNKFRVLDLGPRAAKASAEDIVKSIIDACKIYKPRRLGIDPVTMIGYLAKNELEIRQATLNLGNALSEMGITTILGSEAPISELGYSRFGVEEYMADAIIFMRHEPAIKGKVITKTMEVVKLRGSTHKSGKVPYTVNEKGINVLWGGI